MQVPMCNSASIGLRGRIAKNGKAAPPSRATKASRLPCIAVTARNRVLFWADELSKGSLIHLAKDDTRAQHLTKVLKVQPGNQVKLGIINGKASTAQVLQTTPEVLLKCQDWQQPPTLQELHLILAMPRPKVLKRLWATLACLGVTHIHITGAEKVERVYYGATALQPHRILPQLIIGAEQAADTMLPAVYMCRSLQKTLKSVQYMTNAHSSMHPQSRVMSHCLIPPDLDHALTASSEMKEGDTVSNDPSIEMSMSNSSDLSATGRAYGTDKTLGCDTEDQSAAPAQGYGSAIPFKLLAHVRNGITVRQAIHVACGDATSAGQPVVLAVGPEGGWTAEEVSCFVTAYGYHTVTLGTGRTLDTTTAVIALVSAVAEVLAEQC